MLVEILIALMLLSAVASILPVMLRGVARQRQLEQFDRLAQVELGNAVVRLKAVNQPAEESPVGLSDWFRQRYPEAMLEMELLTNGDNSGDDSQPWRVTVTRSPGDNLPDQEQSVVTWVKSQEGNE